MTQTEILWDTWGVPHIYADTDAGVFRALGWAQMKAHGDLLLQLYGIARGRAAEYWGEKYLESDKLLRRMGLPKQAASWAEQQSPQMRANLEAFVAGVNAHAEARPEQLRPDVRQVLPVTLEDVFAHIQRVYFVYLTQLGQRPLGAPFNDILPNTTLFPDFPNMGTGVAGSNAWAIGPQNTAGGKAILLANPHLFWGDFHTFFEVHLNAPGLELYGVVQVGWPLPRYGFNRHMGWAHTVNTVKAWDAFALEVTPDGKGYRLDGQNLPLEVETETLSVRQPDGTQTAQELKIFRSQHGPVVANQNGKPVAVRVVGVGQFQTPRIFEQYWAKAKARSLGEFRDALRMEQNPLFTVMYADAEGNILHHFGGLIPRRKGGGWLDWSGTLKGDDGSLLWTERHSFDELPHVLNPPPGWLQNANNAPWLTALPPALDPANFPAYMAPRGLTMREQGSLEMIGGQGSATLESVLECAASTRSGTAVRLVPHLIEAARSHGGDLARRAVEVLEAWDKRYDPQSVGGDLFARWLAAMQPRDRMLSNIFAVPWDETRPLETPSGLADAAHAARMLEQVAQDLLREHKTLQRPWGEIVRARRGSFDLPGHGLLDPFGVFRTSGFVKGAEGRWDTVFGTTYVAAVEFSQPLRAKVLLSYGNSSQPDSRHYGDQLALFAEMKMRDAWLTREAVEANLEQREVLEP
ncbi:MAG: penicillin acylase family protein [Meiothermus sp.]|nr:penicillin acylase family protein [Meiothermus sp.]